MVLQGLESHGTRQVNVTRTNIVQDVLEFHKLEHNVQWGVTFHYVGEQGVDVNGITRDVFTLFWRQARYRFLEGNDNSFVPRTTGLTREEYVLIGRILSYGYVTAGIFPSFMNRAFMQALLCGEDSLGDDDLIKGILDFLSVYERERLLRVTSSNHLAPEDRDFMLDFADRGGVTLNPTQGNVKDIVIEVARAILVNVPMHTMLKIKEGMLQIPGCNRIWSDMKVEDLHILYNELLPSPEKVAAILSAACKNQEEERVFSFLRRYTRSLSQESSVKFLRWVTGSETLTVPNIQVEFHRSTEEDPYPRAHVCAGMLDISSKGYETYNKFRRIMDAVICNEEAFTFSSA